MMANNGGWPDNPDNSKAAETAVLQLVPVDPIPLPEKYIRLGTVRQIRSELAAIYRLARSGKMPTSEATRFCYLLTQLANMTVDSEIAERVEKLERERG